MISTAPLIKPEAVATPQPTFSPPTVSPPPPQPIPKNPKKTSPSTPVQQAASLASKAPKLREKETPPQTSNMGVKRTNSEDTLLHKVKKKKIDKAGDGIHKAVPKEVSIMAQPEVEKEKVKIKTNTPSSKKTDDIREGRKPSDSSSTPSSEKSKPSAKASKESKKEAPRETRVKDIKEKPKKEKVVKKPEEIASDEPKVQKLTVKRTSTDAWASTTKSGLNNQNKDNVLDALFNEFGADNSGESGDDDMEVRIPPVNNTDINTDNAKMHPIKTKKTTARTKAITNSSSMDSPKVNGVKKKDVSR